MDDKWNARISDFGITKIKGITNKKRNAQNELKQRTESLGTIYWTAPEVFQGLQHTEASDCYSFGIVLWEMFHRQTPYGGREPMSVVIEVTNNLRPTLDKNLDGDVRELITECWAASPEARPNFEQIANKLKSMISTAGLTHQYNKEPQIEAPTGTAYFVFTDIDGAGELWEDIPMTMLKSITLHNNFLRATLEKCGGYEVEFGANGFLFAFAKIQDAMNLCISAQKGLLNVDWPSELNHHSLGRVVMQNGVIIWSGLRVKMALHTGVSNCEVDRSTGRVNYFGPIIDRTRKLLYASKQSYSIAATSAIVDQFTKKGLSFTEPIVHSNCGEMLDTTRSKTEAIYKILPKSLAAREQIAAADSNNNLPHTVVLVDVDADKDGAEGATTLHASSSTSSLNVIRPTWEIRHEDLEEKDKVGRGSTGDFVHCLWNNQNVTAKVLLNQKVEEADLLILKARASVLSKLKHKNILDFHGVCLDPSHISVIVGFQPHSGLPALLADSSVSLNFKQKVNIIKQIAEGMEYLSSITDHQWLVTFALKSPNVLITRDKLEVKLCDVGQGNLRDLARTMTSVGTVAWTAPEVLEGDENGHTPKSTVYAFGIIMWEVIVQQVPYHDQHPIKVVSKILSGYRPSFNNDVPASYCELAAQCWDANPENRPSWRNILQAIDNML